MRVIVAHLHALSARLHFWMVDYDGRPSVCLPRPLSDLSTLHHDHKPTRPIPHPAQMIRPVAAQLGLAPEQLSVASSQLGWVEQPGEWVPVALLRINGDTLPDMAGGRFITLMELLQVPVTERLLLRSAYEALLGD
ncbi:hypothetical protein ADIMK_3073 [Marinobacterium lacunae]|uniref:Uncharacterized protein n=1 Tax=Marinobacterium lacunae TaxID=1232683 RepID=A0A081FVP6_9GAMM|nr:hypothetical protein [Marinobacterium lacunae]KEA62601.1 hypothetical protein ADIMK_3073 [Marinobacterium lacunae]MBR9882892.1 hypothetical protein [Oceanospirillales bacterium]